MTLSNKSQRIKEGAIMKIDISENRFVFARQFSSDIGIYNLVLNHNDAIPSPLDIIKNKFIFYCSVFDDIIRAGIFQYIGFVPLTAKEISEIPPKFHQDLGTYNCTIFWGNGKEREALPEECVGLEPNMVWEAQGLRERIQDFIAEKKNYHVEYFKVILSESDLRCNAPPLSLVWDFEKHEFYRKDR